MWKGRRGRVCGRKVGMNRLEARYAAYLESLKQQGEILDYGFERIKLKLADNTFYCPDFDVTDKDNYFSIHEVKGYWEDDARVKIKVAAALFPFAFVAIKERPKKNGGGWEFEEF